MAIDDVEGVLADWCALRCKARRLGVEVLFDPSRADFVLEFPAGQVPVRLSTYPAVEGFVLGYGAACESGRGTGLQWSLEYVDSDGDDGRGVARSRVLDADANDRQEAMWEAAAILRPERARDACLILSERIVHDEIDLSAAPMREEGVRRGD